MVDKTVIVKIEYDAAEAKKSVQDLTAVVEGETVAQSKLKAELEAGKISQKEYSEAVEESKNIAKKANSERKDTIKLLGSEKGSVNELKASIKNLTTERDKLNRNTKEGAKKYQELTDKINIQKRALKDVNDSTRQSTGFMGKLTGALRGGIAQFALAAGAIGVAVTGLIKFGTAVVNSSGALQDKLEVALAQAGAAVDTFFTALSSSEGFNNFGANMRTAMKAAKDFTEGMDDLKDATRSQRLQESEMASKLAELELEYKKGNLTLEQRNKAVTEYLEGQKKLADANKELTQQEEDLWTNRLVAKTGLDAETIKSFARDYKNQKDMLKLGDEYNQLVNELFIAQSSLAGRLFDNPEKIAADIKALGSGAVEAGRLADAFSKITAEKKGVSMLDNLSAAMIKNNEANAKFIDENMKALVKQADIQSDLTKQNTKVKEETVEREKLFIDEIAIKTIESDQIVYDNKEVLAQQEIDLKNRVISDKAKAQAKADADELAKAEQIATAKSELAEAAEKAVKQFAIDQYNAKIDNELNKTKIAAEAKEQVLKDELDKGNISQEAYEKKLAALKLKTRKAEAKAEKKKALFEIALQTLMGSIKAVASSPVTFGLPFLPFVVAEGALSEIAVAAKPEPTYAKGGIIGGKSHSQGGTRFVGSDGSRFEAERGEAMFVLKKDATAEIAALSAINESFGGRSFGSGSAHLEDGGNVQPVDVESEVNKAMQRTPIYVKVSDVSLGLSSVEKVKNVGVI